MMIASFLYPSDQNISTPFSRYVNLFKGWAQDHANSLMNGMNDQSQSQDPLPIFTLRRWISLSKPCKTASKNPSLKLSSKRIVKQRFSSLSSSLFLHRGSSSPLSVDGTQCWSWFRRVSQCSKKLFPFVQILTIWISYKTGLGGQRFRRSNRMWGKQLK